MSASSIDCSLLGDSTESLRLMGISNSAMTETTRIDMMALSGSQ